MRNALNLCFYKLYMFICIYHSSMKTIFSKYMDYVLTSIGRELHVLKDNLPVTLAIVLKKTLLHSNQQVLKRQTRRRIRSICLLSAQSCNHCQYSKGKDSFEWQVGKAPWSQVKELWYQRKRRYQIEGIHLCTTQTKKGMVFLFPSSILMQIFSVRSLISVSNSSQCGSRLILKSCGTVWGQKLLTLPL